MPFISSLKENFAIAPIQDREAVVKKLTTANTEDGNYYRGLIILQKIYDEVMKQPEPTKSREATSVERDLSNEMQALLNKSSFPSGKHLELNTRYHLLIYPFDTLKSIDFIKTGLCLDLVSQKQDQSQVDENKHIQSNVPSVLDEKLIDGFSLLKKSFDEFQINGSLDMEVMAFPQFNSDILGKNLLSEHEEVAALKVIFSHPSQKIFGNDILDRLARLWKIQVTQNKKLSTDGWDLQYLPFYNFTLAQMDYLIAKIPNIVLLEESFINTYLEKLIPAQFFERYSRNENITFWDDDENILQDYLKNLEDFANKLPAIYYPFKSAIKFYQLRIDIVRQDFNETRFIQYLQSSSNASTATSPVPSRITNLFSSNSSSNVRTDSTTVKTVNQIPLLGQGEISRQDKLLVVQEYLTGLISQSKFTTNIESLGAYMDYHYVLKPLYAKLMLTLTSESQDSWSNDLGYNAFEKLVSESSVSFTPSTLNASIKRKPNDPIKLSVRTKNIQRLTIRVFQIDVENYSRLHIDGNEHSIADKNNKIDLDGLCPSWEKDIDFSSVPSIRVQTNDFVFGDNGIAPEVFHGRGLWVIEFVGGQNQCRAVIQKGYLRHIIQESVGGHVVRVIDEEGKTLEKSKIWCANQYYQADESNNILIPYLPFKTQSKMSKMLLISTADDFSESASFYQLSEDYKLEADFYVNPEMVSFNKKVTVIVNPRLTMNGSPVSLSLLEKASLSVKCTNADDITNNSVCQNLSKYPNAIHFDFMVPERLTHLSFNLQAKVRTLKDTLETVDVQHNINYSSPVDNTGVPASVHLRQDSEGDHFIYAFGKNGETKKGYEVSLKLKHSYIAYRQVEVSLKTNDEGFIKLGKLKNIQWIEYSNSQGTYKQWLVNCVKQSLLPPAVCSPANTPFKINRPILPVSDLLFSLYKTGVREMLIEDVSDCIQKTESHIVVSGLPEGEYMLYIASQTQGTKQIKCTIIGNQSSQDALDEKDKKERLWSDWIIGTDKYAKQNGIVLSRPFDISNVSVSNDAITVQLQNWNSKAFVVATTNTFIPTSSELLKQLIDNRSLIRPLSHEVKSESIKSQFLDDKTLGEEYQYVLNRARAEKWVGNTLTKPTLLMYPKKNADTSSNSRHLATEMSKKKRKVTGFGRSFTSSVANVVAGSMSYCKMMASPSQYSESSLAFLDHNCPVLIIPVNSDGIVSIDRKSLGSGGSYLQLVAFSGEQAIVRNMALPDVPASFVLNDLRQKENSNKALIRSKVIKSLGPTEHLTIGTNEYETIDSFEKLFEMIKVISTLGDSFAEKFDYLKTWATLDEKKKLELHEKKVCDELNLWLKKKDNAFFEQNVRPSLQSKIQKSFMDLYLIDGDLSEYTGSIYKFNQLNTAEKALLATASSKEFLQTVLRTFKEDFDDKKVSDRSDAIFDSILAGSALSLSSADEDDEDEDEDLGYALEVSEVESAQYAPTSPAYSPASFAFGSAAAPPPAPSIQRSALRSAPVIDRIQLDGPVEDDSEELQEVANELREKAKQRQKKVAYEFVKPTSEWIETGRFNQDDTLGVKKFWIDFLEYNLNKCDNHNWFLSDNFMYCLSNLTEIFYVLSLSDLPFASETNWSMEATLAETEGADSNAVQLTISSSNEHPLMVFYRTLTDCDANSLAAGNQKNSLLLGQELFLFDESTPIESDECIKINPTSGAVETMIEYGSHVIISNASGKPLNCQVTVQVPTGSVPCKNTPYCKSKTITINAYSTWHEVTGSFYFPKAGQFAMVPITVSTLSGDKLLGNIGAIDITVKEKSTGVENESSVNADSSQSLSLSSWANIANNGSNASVLSFLENYKKLDRLDLRIIAWRMKDRSFARQAFDILSGSRHFFAQELWKYGVYHQFGDIISDLLNFSRTNILDNTGQVFDSPLVSRKRKDISDLFDYYPLLNARAHPLKSTSHEILNDQFYQQYDEYLNYLSQLTREPSSADLVVLALYLILQDRIGDAQSIFSRIQTAKDDADCKVQIDYLEAYLKTRIPVATALIEEQYQDLKAVKEIASNYKDFGNPKWRNLFNNLYDFVCEVEQGESPLTGDPTRDNTVRIQSEPLLEFEVNQQNQELVIQFANVKSIDIKYYEMNIEVMFSTNPFMNDRTTTMSNSDNFTWIKPSSTLRIDLPEKQKVEADVDDFDMIGVGQVNSMQTLNVPLATGNKNLFIEISSVGTPNTIKRRQAYFSNSLHTHIAESFGIVRVLSGKTKRPLAGAYVKVYAKMKHGQKVHFWKDGYTGLNGVFDYIGVTEGNALMGESQTDLKKLMDEEVDKLSILIISTEEGAVVKEAYPPLTAF